jgi:ABC-type uncharacterized transport system substrate-binding protein
MRLSRFVSLLVRVLPLVAFVVSGEASAHPHVWIKYAVRVEIEGTSIVAIAETWRFSEGFPVQLVGIDSLPDTGTLDAKQTAVFKDQAFSSLAGLEYFNHLFVDGEPQSFGDPADFRVSVDHGKIVYAFTLKLAKPVQVTKHQVALGIWDESYFVDYEPDATAVSISGHAAAACTTKAFADHAHPIFGGFVIPQATAISC